MKILLCVDKQAQRRPIKLVAGLAEKLNAEVELLVVSETYEEMDEAEEILEEEVSVLAHKAPKVEGELMKGLAADLLEKVGESDYYMIILSFKGRRGLKTVFPRPEMITIMKHSKIPVLGIRGKKETISKVLFCTGGSDYARRAIEYGAEIALAFHAEASILHVADIKPALAVEGPNIPFEYLETRHPEVAHELMKIKDNLGAKGLKANILLRYGHPSERIVQESELNDYDLIVMSSHGMGAIRALVCGSVCRDVVRMSNIPVLVVPADYEKKAENSTVRPRTDGSTLSVISSAF